MLCVLHNLSGAHGKPRTSPREKERANYSRLPAFWNSRLVKQEKTEIAPVVVVIGVGDNSQVAAKR